MNLYRYPAGTQGKWMSRDIFLVSLLSALVSMSMRFLKGRYFCLVLGAAMSAASASAQPQADLSPVHLDLLPTRVQTGRWVWMGDSFTAPARARVPFASLLTWPLERLGAVATGPLARMTRLVPGPLGREISDDDAFVLAPGTPLESTMGRPVYRLVEWDLPVGVTDLGDGPGDLMAERQRPLQTREVARVELTVGAADPARSHVEAHVARRW